MLNNCWCPQNQKKFSAHHCLYLWCTFRKCNYFCQIVVISYDKSCFQFKKNLFFEKWHCVKYAKKTGFHWPVFFRIRTESYILYLYWRVGNPASGNPFLSIFYAAYVACTTVQKYFAPQTSAQNLTLWWLYLRLTKKENLQNFLNDFLTKVSLSRDLLHAVRILRKMFRKLADLKKANKVQQQQQQKFKIVQMIELLNLISLLSPNAVEIIRGINNH